MDPLHAVRSRAPAPADHRHMHVDAPARRAAPRRAVRIVK
ncbi:Hypothetical protein A7982_00883 [Minicystis rosea]|nr:Hypothetical protein A7982_00883 [Minicystis rosea]